MIRSKCDDWYDTNTLFAKHSIAHSLTQNYALYKKDMSLRHYDNRMLGPPERKIYKISSQLLISFGQRIHS